MEVLCILLENASIWVTRYLLYQLLSFWGDISHSRENKCNHFQSKGNVENAKMRDITDLSLVGERNVFLALIKQFQDGNTQNCLVSNKTFNKKKKTQYESVHKVTNLISI